MLVFRLCKLLRRFFSGASTIRIAIGVVNTLSNKGFYNYAPFVYAVSELLIPSQIRASTTLGQGTLDWYRC